MKVDARVVQDGFAAAMIPIAAVPPRSTAPCAKASAPTARCDTLSLGGRRRAAAGRIVAWIVARRGTLGLTALALLVFANGADRRPADSNEPLVLREAQRIDGSSRETLRLGTFNIHGGKGPDGAFNLDGTARTLEGLDLVALQEIHGNLWTGNPDQCTLLGDRLNAASLFAPTEYRWWGDNRGNGLLTRVPLASWQRIPIAGTQTDRFRNVLLVRVPLGSATVCVVTGHLDDRADHDAHLAAVVELFLALESPAVLVGDLNTLRSEPQFQRLLADPSVTAVVGESLPGGRSMRGVDWIIARGLRCVASESRDIGASDHPAVVAELALIPAEGIGHSERRAGTPARR